MVGRFRPFHALALAVCALLLPQSSLASFVTAFESGPVRPLALSPDGNTLLAVNTPDNRLEIFAVSGGALTHSASVPVGLEPVSVAARSNTEVWVVNHLSDSVSIVDIGSSPHESPALCWSATSHGTSSSQTAPSDNA